MRLGRRWEAPRASTLAQDGREGLSPALNSLGVSTVAFWGILEGFRETRVEQVSYISGGASACGQTHAPQID